MHGPGALRESIEDPQGFVQTNPARDALAARLGMGELDEVARHIHHAVLFIHDHHAARSHDRAQLRQAFIVDGRIEHLDGNASARGTTRLHRLDGASGNRSFTNVIHEGFQRSAQRHLHQSGVAHLPHQGEDFGPRAFRTARFAEPGRAAGDDRRDVVPRLNIVDVGGTPPESLLRGKWRPGPGPSRFAFQGRDQGCFFPADESAGSLDHFYVELESTSQDVVAEHAIFMGLLNRTVQPMHGQGILGADVNDALGRTHDVAADDHAFQQRVGIALDLVAVHVSAGIALVRIADDVLAIGLSLIKELPLVAREISGAAPAAQFRCLDLFDHGLGPSVNQNLVERLVSSDADVFLNIVGIDEPAVAQNDLLLALEERHFVPGWHFRIATPISHVAGNVFPFLDLAVDMFGSDVPHGKIMQDWEGVVRLHPPQDQQRLARQSHIDQRLLETSAETADAGKQDIHPRVLNGFGKGVLQTLGAIAPAASPHPDGNAGDGRKKLGEPRFTDCTESSNVLDSRHHSLSF